VETKVGGGNKGRFIDKQGMNVRGGGGGRDGPEGGIKGKLLPIPLFGGV